MKKYKKQAKKCFRGKWVLVVFSSFLVIWITYSNNPVNIISNCFDLIDIGDAASTVVVKLGGPLYTVREKMISVLVTICVLWLGLAIVFFRFCVGGALQLGYVRSLYKVSEKKSASFRDVFYYFRSWSCFIRGALSAIIPFGTIFLWTLLFIIPGITKWYSYAFSSLVLVEHPEYSVGDAMKKSEEMMKGNRLTLLGLQISFLGWCFLSILTLFIGLLWVYPYYQASKMQFYLDVKKKNLAPKGKRSFFDF